MKVLKLLALLLFFSSCSLISGQKGEESPLQIKLLDVGQGEAILLQCPDKTTQVLIDAGNSDSAYPGAEELFLKSLISETGADRKVEYAINTHSDPDHLEGFRSLLSLKSMQIEKFFHNGVLPGDISLLLEKNSVPIEDLSKSDTLEITPCKGRDDIKLKILRIPEHLLKRLNCPFNKNDCSLVMRLDYGLFRMLLTGDTTLYFEELVLAEPLFLEFFSADVLKIGHHASQSSSEKLLQTVNPDYVVYSAGQPGVGSVEKWGYPRDETIDRLISYFKRFTEEKNKYLLWVCKYQKNSCIWLPRAINRRILPTTIYGTIVIETNGNNFTVSGRNKYRLLKHTAKN